MSGVAREVFEVLLSFDYTVKLYDDSGMVVAEPSEARRMFAASPNLMVTLDDADDDSAIKLLFGKSTHANDIDGLIQALRTTATKYNVSFEDKQFGKEIDPKDYQNIMKVAESKREREMAVCEGMYGTSRTSYLLLDNAKMIVHHTQRINLTESNARAKHIGSIFIEDINGNRMTFPTTDLKAARAIAEHIDQGGTFGDAAAKIILDSFIPPPAKNTVPYLAENHPAIRDFIDWTNQFELVKVLTEWNDPNDPYEGHANSATDQAIDQFDLGDFLSSDAFENLTKHMQPNTGGEDSELDKHDLLGTLAHYLRTWIETYTHEFHNRGFNEDTMDIAKHLLPKVVDGVQQAGWIIADEPSVHMEAMPEGEEFTREDILLPNKDQGDKLSREVSKSMVHDDPANPDEEHPPGMGYLGRMKTLAGLGTRHSI
jgi:hypothetical protein